ncbi:Dephospho-CoA kinase [Rickettsiales bacterium Ac37b]|nr:Dephospho-CoA kinase [Rickettsiales bacterium Ac37b]
MIIVGLTGSIAMGKSFIANQFKYYQIDSFNCDLMIDKIIRSNENAYDKIKNKFPETIDKENKIDKTQLSEIVFADHKRLSDLETILYPLLNKEMDVFVKKSIYYRRKMVLIDIPLLFEKSYQHKFDYIIVVSASKYMQKRRALKRYLMTEKKLEKILRYQLSDYKKRKKADFVIHTGAGKSFSMREIKKFLCVKSF